jgi:hypothetical protein
MLCSYSTDIVPWKIESGEFLFWSIMVYMQLIRRQVALPCCFAVLEPDVVLLQHQYCSHKDREQWVSILIGNGVYAIAEKKSCLTVFFFSAWARCCAPSSPILFDERWRVVSVYFDRSWWICHRWEDKLSYRIVVQCLSQMLCSYSTDMGPTKIESSECLYWSLMV